MYIWNDSGQEEIRNIETAIEKIKEWRIRTISFSNISNNINNKAKFSSNILTQIKDISFPELRELELRNNNIESA